ncbi:MAG: MATE family efflux transporter, partial [Armatimonadia bacterium]
MSTATQTSAQVSQRTADLGTMPLGRLLVTLSLPSIAGMVVMSLYNLIDTFWVGRLPHGTAAMAALTILFPLQMVAGSLGMGAGVGVSSLAARRFGA